ncbi:MAG: hypothetical protein E4H13_13375 [Calditrichales bacterium]|nr:MAG: hypothetical protein E4H13_13375 [Calditrichales bacterium]
MWAFIGHNLKLLFTPGAIIFIIGYNSFAWFLSSPPLDPVSAHNTDKLLGQYDWILYSLGFFAFLHIMLTHFHDQVQTTNLVVIRTRLTTKEIFNGLLLAYFLFFLVGFVLSSYLTASIQQQIQSPRTLDYAGILYKTLSGFCGNVLLWIISALCLFWYFREEFIVLVMMLIVYVGTFIINGLTGGIFLDHWWIYRLINEHTIDFWRTSVIFMIWIVLNLVIYYKAGHVFRTMFAMPKPGYLKKGFVEEILEKFNAGLSAHHAGMLGFSAQKTRYFFAVLGLAIVLILIKSPAVKLERLLYIYLGGFLPVLFSFNQYLMIKVDLAAGMVHNNYLRKISYAKIVLNRWVLLLLPQLAINLLILVMLKQCGYDLSGGMLLYIPMLHIFFSLLALYLNIVFCMRGAANVIIAGFAYLLLREDVHQFLLQNHHFGTLNIFMPLLTNNLTAPAWQGGLLFAGILILYMITVRAINRMKFSELAANY